MIGELFECHRWLLTKFETRCIIEQVWSTITNNDLESRQRLCFSRCVRLILLCFNAILIVVIFYIKLRLPDSVVGLSYPKIQCDNYSDSESRFRPSDALSNLNAIG